MATLFTLPRQVKINVAGRPYAGAQAFFYKTATETQQTVYQDQALTVEHPQPILANDDGYFPVIWLDDFSVFNYRVRILSATGLLLDDIDNVQASLVSSPQIISAVTTNLDSLKRTQAEIDGGVTPVNYAYMSAPYYDMKRVLNLTPGADNTAVVQTVYNMALLTGGTLIFPAAGDFSFYLDISSTLTSTKDIVIDAQGSTFRPFTATPPHSAVIYCDDTAAAVGWNDTRLTLRNVYIDGRLYNGGSPIGTGAVNYGFYMKSAAARFDRCYFMYGKIAGFYGNYTQYTEFFSCRFLNCTFNASSVGCYLDSIGTGASTNEVLFNRCWFGSSKNGLWIRGGLKIRIMGATVMGCSGGTLGGGHGGGIILDTDATNFGNEGTLILASYFEGNDVPHVNVQVAPNSKLSHCSFAASGHPSVIQYDFCFSAVVEDCEQYGGNLTANFLHSGATDASLIFRGNNFPPVVSFTNTGLRILDQQSAPLNAVRNDNLMCSSAQTGLNGIPLVASQQIGFKTGVARTVSTQLFSMTLASFATNYEPTAVFEVQIHAWQDNAASGDYGYCARIERFPVLFFNTSGTTGCVVGTSEGGYDISQSSAFRTIGTITLSVAVAGGTATFSASYTGAGTGATGITSVTMGYTVKEMGANPFTLQRL
jgi:hypothetical protein